MTPADTVELRVQILPHAADLPPPSYATAGAAGLDLYAAIDAATPLRIAPMRRVAVPTGVAVEIPPDCEGQLRARSGRALRDGLALVNGVGTIDSDYRGEIQVAVVNLSDWPLTIRRGERIAQLVIAPIRRAVVTVTTELSPSTRNHNGFGSTGK